LPLLKLKGNAFTAFDAGEGLLHKDKGTRAQFFVHVGLPFLIKHLSGIQIPVPCQDGFPIAQSAESLARQRAAGDGEAGGQPNARIERGGLDAS
jgi:hypothetical protein